VPKIATPDGKTRQRLIGQEGADAALCSKRQNDPALDGGTESASRPRLSGLTLNLSVDHGAE
jgi:hypothetical protein